MLHCDVGVAFQLRKDETLAHGLERLVRRELRDAIDQLAGMDVSEAAVHEARKSIKKVRAILLLVGDEIDANGALKQLRQAGRVLAPLRDAEALVLTASELCGRQPLSATTCSALRDQLSTRQSRLVGSRRSRRLNKQAADVLKKAHQSARRWRWRKVRVSALLDELRRNYKKARRTMRKARVRPGAEAFHTWRKRVKSLWYALRLLPRHSPSINRHLGELEHLETWLGEDQNLAVLRSRLSNGLELPGLARVLLLAEQRQRTLRRRALTVGAREFKDTSKVFTQRVERLLHQMRDAA